MGYSPRVSKSWTRLSGFTFTFSYNGNRLHLLNTEAGQHCNSEMDSGARSLNRSLTATVPQYLFLRNGINDSTCLIKLQCESDELVCRRVPRTP